MWQNIKPAGGKAEGDIVAIGHAFPCGIYDDRLPVGFLMIGLDTDNECENPSAKGNDNLWRLMIDERYQHRGNGKAALRLALGFVRSFPYGSSEHLWLSHQPEYEQARRLYQSFGIEETCETDGQEKMAVLNLSKFFENIFSKRRNIAQQREL